MTPTCRSGHAIMWSQTVPKLQIEITNAMLYTASDNLNLPSGTCLRRKLCRNLLFLSRVVYSVALPHWKTHSRGSIINNCRKGRPRTKTPVQKLQGPRSNIIIIIVNIIHHYRDRHFFCLKYIVLPALSVTQNT